MPMNLTAEVLKVLPVSGVMELERRHQMHRIDVLTRSMPDTSALGGLVLTDDGLFGVEVSRNPGVAGINLMTHLHRPDYSRDFSVDICRMDGGNFAGVIGHVRWNYFDGSRRQGRFSALPEEEPVYYGMSLGGVLREVRQARKLLKTAQR